MHYTCHNLLYSMPHVTDKTSIQLSRENMIILQEDVSLNRKRVINVFNVNSIVFILIGEFNNIKLSIECYVMHFLVIL